MMGQSIYRPFSACRPIVAAAMLILASAGAGLAQGNVPRDDTPRNVVPQNAPPVRQTTPPVVQQPRVVQPRLDDRPRVQQPRFDPSNRPPVVDRPRRDDPPVVNRPRRDDPPVVNRPRRDDPSRPDYRDRPRRDRDDEPRRRRHYGPGGVIITPPIGEDYYDDPSPGYDPYGPQPYGRYCHVHRYRVPGVIFHRSVRCHRHDDPRDPSLRYVRPPY